MITWGKLTFQHAKSIKWNKEGHFVFSKKYTQFWDLMVIKIYLSDNRIKIYTVKNCIVLLVVVVLVAQSCLTLCDPMDYSPSDPSVHGILQARILEWVTISFSRKSIQHRNQTWVYLHCRQILYRLSHQWTAGEKLYRRSIFWE